MVTTLPAGSGHQFGSSDLTARMAGAHGSGQGQSTDVEKQTNKVRRYKGTRALHPQTSTLSLSLASIPQGT